MALAEDIQKYADQAGMPLGDFVEMFAVSMDPEYDDQFRKWFHSHLKQEYGNATIGGVIYNIDTTLQKVDPSRYEDERNDYVEFLVSEGDIIRIGEDLYWDNDLLDEIPRMQQEAPEISNL